MNATTEDSTRDVGRPIESADHLVRGGTLLYLTKQLERLMRVRLEEAVVVANLTWQQYTALTVLERRPGLTSAQLARGSFVRAQTMAQVINTLDDRGLITRSRDHTNKRQYLIFLTDEGGAVLDLLRDSVEAIERMMVSGLTEAEVMAFRHALYECRSSLSGV